MSNGNVWIMFTVIIVFALAFLVVIFWTRKGPRPFDIEKYRSNWLNIEQSLNQNEPASYTMAVLNADKLLDQAMRDKGCSGKTEAERMKSVQHKWSHKDDVWQAHKLRNKIAHETGFVVNYTTAQHAVYVFKQALKELGAI